MNFSPEDAIEFCKEMYAIAKEKNTKITVSINGNASLNFPGYKKSKGDYALELPQSFIYSKLPSRSHKPSHGDIASYLNDNVNAENYSEVVSILNHLYNKGTKSYFRTASAHFFEPWLQDIVFWTSLQEEINYPLAQGKNMAYSRYFEGLLAAFPDSKIKLYDVLNRCKNHNGKAPPRQAIQKTIKNLGWSCPEYYFDYK